jgi:hypothetical protein
VNITPVRKSLRPAALNMHASPAPVYHNLQDPPTPSGRLSDRIERLRSKCLEALGKDVFREAYNFLKNESRGILNMPCGTGKTFVTYLLSLDFDNIILLTPLISTT